jgi:hypothetical protein
MSVKARAPPSKTLAKGQDPLLKMLAKAPERPSRAPARPWKMSARARDLRLKT